MGCERHPKYDNWWRCHHFGDKWVAQRSHIEDWRIETEGEVDMDVFVDLAPYPAGKVGFGSPFPVNQSGAQMAEDVFLAAVRAIHRE